MTEPIEAAAREIVKWFFECDGTQPENERQTAAILRKHFAPQASGESKLGDLTDRVYDLAHETPASELFGYMVDHLTMAAERIQERMVEDGRMSIEPNAAQKCFANALRDEIHNAGCWSRDFILEAVEKHLEKLRHAFKARATPPAARDGAMVVKDYRKTYPLLYGEPTLPSEIKQAVEDFKREVSRAGNNEERGRYAIPHARKMAAFLASISGNYSEIPNSCSLEAAEQTNAKET